MVQTQIIPILDGDGLTDWYEIINGFDPLDYNDPTNNDSNNQTGENNCPNL